jgi:cytochrome c peroxidase
MMALLIISCSDGNDQGEVFPGVENAGDNTPDMATAMAEQIPESDGIDAMVGTNPAISIGDVQTIEIDNVVFTSLPEARVDTTSPTVELGRLLFWDPILSGDQDTACATCHLPEFGYADGRRRSVGTSGVGTGPDRIPGQLGEVSRNAQSVLNTLWNGINELGMFDQETAPMFWDRRTESLVAQALEPIRSREEMRGDNFSEAEIDAVVLERLSGIADYQVRFAEAFGSSTITLDTLARALSDFQSTLIANNAPFDRWMRGDSTAMTAQQLQGLEVFAETGCADCHSGPMFSDFETHVLGVPEAANLNTPDTGDGNFGFRTPTLRQLAFTAPYFHGGQDTDLDDVIDFYDNPGRSENPNVPTNQLDPDFRALPNLNGNEQNAIEAFLQSLSDDGFDRTRPESVPSGLPVGGSL